MKSLKKYIISIFAALTLVCCCPVCCYAEADAAVSDDDGSNDGEVNVGRIAIFAVVGGVVVGFVTTGSMKAQLKSVHSEKAARQYIKQGSFNVKVRRDIFLYQKVEKKPRENKS